MKTDYFMDIAIHEAEKSLTSGGIPIGSALVIKNKLVAQGHNQRIQKSSSILHAEMDCINNAGRLTYSDYSQATIYSTLSPCEMCSGAILLYKIKKIIIGENDTFKGPEEYVKSKGVEIVNYNNNRCKKMMKSFISNHPSLWDEDIGK